VTAGASPDGADMNHATPSTADAFEPLRFSTDQLPARDRLAIWREVFGRRIAKAEFEAFPDVQFSHNITFRKLNGLSLGFTKAVGFRATRAQQHLGDGSDDLILTINTEGIAHSSQLGREVRVGPFDGAMMSCAEWGQISVPDSAGLIIVAVPRKPIAAMVKDPEAAAGRLLRKETESLRLLTSYVSTAENGFSVATPALRHVFATHVQDLVALVLGATRDSTELAHGRGVRAARLAAIKADISERVGHGDLSVGQIAAMHGLTPRYVQMLFETEGMTFTEFLLAQRLARAHRMLVDPRFAERSVTSIAFDAGFADLSYFDRAFRRRFAETPSDTRESTRRKNGG
jgi:AraC-like DNA-binding protein